MNPHEARFLLGVSAFVGGSHASARQHIKRALEDAYSPEGASTLLDAMLLQGEGEEAQSLASKFRREHPKEAGAWMDEGYVSLSRGNAWDAIRQASVALELEPADPYAWLLFGMAQEAAGARHAALPALRRAHALSEGTLRLRVEYILIAYAGSANSASGFLLDHLRDFTEHYRDRCWALNEALILDERSVIAELLPLFTEQDQSLLVRLARHHVELYVEKDVENSLRLARSLVRDFPRVGQAYYALAVSLSAAKKARASAKAYRTAAELIPASFTLALRAARGSLLAWQPRLARLWAERALGLSPGSQKATQVLFVCHVLCGRFSDAVALARDLAAGGPDHV